MANTIRNKRGGKVRERRDRRRNRRLVGLKPNQVREGVLVAEGDSWFSFPNTNVLYQLRCLGYSITSVAESGDTMAEMAENKDELRAAYKRAVRDHGVVDAVLLSGGGNEVMAGRLGSTLLRKGAAGTLNNGLVSTTIDEIEGSYTQIIHQIKGLPGTTPPVFVHGYDYPIPDGRGIEDAKIFYRLADALPIIKLPGPWMAPQFKGKGYEWPQDRVAMIQTMVVLVDKFNDMLISLANQYTFVHHIDLRWALLRGSDHKRHWHDELHPTGRGFRKVMIEFDEHIQRVIG